MSTARLHLAMLVLALVLVATLAHARTNPTVVETSVATITIDAADGWYPGPVQAVVEHDSLGVVVVTRARLLFGERTYVPWMSR